MNRLPIKAPVATALWKTIFNVIFGGISAKTSHVELLFASLIFSLVLLLLLVV